ncbi:MAG TPA: MBL fold metallo-hydrolase [Myxococcales bacterium]|nr:MBL fold metallo-hydrolase [Myxococcales bacterium]
MARRELAVAENVPGDLFVDESCIECDTCRELAPDVFGSLDSGQSFVRVQPADDATWRRALHAVVSCPTSSIGAERSAKEAANDLPVALDGPVYRCGYSSEASYGAQSYLIVRSGGNILVDSPRFVAPLARRIAELGGIRQMFLTHRDDVADHARFHERFGCERIIHRDDAVIDAEVLLDGDTVLAPGLRVIHVPGHTRGSCVLLVDDQYLFTGDHLWAWDGRLEMGRNVSWYSWAEQKKSLRKLLDYRFEWVLPGHGRSLHLPAAGMKKEMESLAKRVATS